MKCSICNTEGGMLVPHVNAETKENQNICMDCMAKQSISNLKSLEKIDNSLKEYDKLLKDIEELVQKMPGGMEVPEGLENFAFTPMTMYNSMQKAVAELKGQRLKILTEVGSKGALEYEQKIAIENEDYEKADKIKQKLDELKSK